MHYWLAFGRLGEFFDLSLNQDSGQSAGGCNAIARYGRNNIASPLPLAHQTYRRIGESMSKQAGQPRKGRGIGGKMRSKQITANELIACADVRFTPGAVYHVLELVNGRIAALEARIEEVDAVIVSLTNENYDLFCTIAELERQLATAETRAEKADKEIIRQKNINEVLRCTISDVY